MRRIEFFAKVCYVVFCRFSFIAFAISYFSGHAFRHLQKFIPRFQRLRLYRRLNNRMRKQARGKNRPSSSLSSLSSSGSFLAKVGLQFSKFDFFSLYLYHVTVKLDVCGYIWITFYGYWLHWPCSVLMPQSWQYWHSCFVESFVKCISLQVMNISEVFFSGEASLSILTWSRVEDESAGAESEPDLDDQCIFVPVPYGINIDRSKAQVIVRNGIQGIIINPKIHGE